MITPQVLTSEDQHRAPAVHAGFRDFARVIGLTRKYRTRLILGLIAGVGFAGLQTASLSAVFPVFKILLEEEGLHGWAYRTLAGERLGVEFEPVAQGASARVVRILVPVRAARNHLTVGDRLHAASMARVVDLHRLLSESTDDVEVVVQPEGGRQSVSRRLKLEFLSTPLRVVRWLMNWIPESATQDRLRTLTIVLSVMVLTSILGNAFRYVGEVTVSGAILRSLMDLRESLYERTLRLPLTFFARQPTADIVTRFVQDIQEIQRGLLTMFGKAIREPIRAVFILALALAADWRITAAMAVLAPIVVVFFWFVGRRVKKANQRLLQSYGTMIDALSSSLQNLRTVKAYNAEHEEHRRLERVDRQMFRQQLRLAKLDALVGPVVETVGVAAAGVVIVWLASRVLNLELTASKFFGLGVILSMLFDPLRKLTDVLVRIQRSSAGAQRIFEVLDHPIESSAPSSATLETPPRPGPSTARREIEFREVSFTYPGANQRAIQNLSLRIEGGETVALVGPNGSGKTTLVGLIPRFFDPNLGTLLIDGVDIRTLDLVALRRKISLVSQEAVVFAGTPLENIVYGSTQVDRNRVEDAARRAFADDFIRQLPGGYEARIGERGTTLSGGQRQRLAIARAIYRDAPLLIFDEATSQVDSDSERKIQMSLTELAQDRTTIVIAHRLSTIQIARRVLVMDEGRLVDSGTHGELYDRCQLYRTLCETQLASAPSTGTTA